MPARAKPALLRTSRPSRIAKEKAKRTIKTATTSKSKIPITRPVVISVNNSDLSPGSESPLEGSPEPQRRAYHNDLREDIEKMVRDTMAKVLASQDEKEKEGSAVNSAAALQMPGKSSDEGTDSSSLPMFAPPAAAAPRIILSHWPWVEKDTIELIANGYFKIDVLPKLHRTDELRNAYLKKSLKGIYQPLEGGPAEVIVGTTKLHSSFKEPTQFFLAWHIYMSIRTMYEPVRAAGLTAWTERLFYLVHLNYPWASILEYIIAYFQQYQNASPEDWFNPDSTLIAYHLTLSQQKALTAPVSLSESGPESESNASHESESFSDEICLIYNRPTGCTWEEQRGEICPHRHVCIICTSNQHTALTCPEKSTN